ncbi:RSPO2 protein, partial [Leiothrix lutea]|nr:RSPO2 protein [Leiothrix lutea]
MQWIIFMLLLFISSMEMLTQNRWKKQGSTQQVAQACSTLSSGRGGRLGGASSPFPLPRAAAWAPQVLGPRRVPGMPGVPGCPADRPSLPAECRSPSCESCFSRDFCMKCKDKFYLYKGQCFRQCPPGTAAQPGTRECQETCEPGPWSEWSACTHESRTCGCKWGVETRVREVPEAAREERTACPAQLETRRCRMKKHCPGGK